ncbi:MAG: C69 family dipeptidase [Apilactobacillus sp.]|uniref:C69 family dipeptidase n=1 Tax=Apilactobacillus sp. TaxID=2767901 RepID=UPI0025E40EFE|nr:C69 family dipeptidase [Apilactobacillus sp.]MCT6822333.1 C69 family dipeptidase [Apilactobacillus sp.]
MPKFPEYDACTSILVGKNASVDGSTMIGRNEDCKATWPKHFIVHPHKEYKEEQLFKAKENRFSCTLPKVRYKYTATPEWTDKEGLFEEEGINEKGVAMSATESAYSNSYVLGYDPLLADGISEASIVTVVLPYADSARDAVNRLGEIVSTHGAAESNGILFSDADEVWYFEIGSGHHWVAMKIPDDSYAVVSNRLAIQEIDFTDNDNFAWSKDILAFVNDNKLNKANDGTFNFREIFGTRSESDLYYNNPRVWYGQRMFNPEITQDPEDYDMPFVRKPSRLISVQDAKDFLASHYEGTEFDPVGKGPIESRKRYRPISLAKAQESHVLQIRPNLPIEVSGIHWLSMGVAAQSVFVPFFAGINDTPKEYKIGDMTYDPKSAYWIFKLVGVLLDPHYNHFVDVVGDVQERLNISFQQKINQVDAKATDLDHHELSEYTTKISNECAELAMNSYQNLAYKLIAASTDFSKLNYNTDENL